MNADFQDRKMKNEFVVIVKSRYLRHLRKSASHRKIEP